MVIIRQKQIGFCRFNGHSPHDLFGPKNVISKKPHLLAVAVLNCLTQDPLLDGRRYWPIIIIPRKWAWTSPNVFRFQCNHFG